MAPHLAAQHADVALDWSLVQRAHAALADQHDLVLVEGAGGWRVPFDGQQGFDDLVAAEGWPVLLVVGMRLGCINHALLSAESIVRRNRLVGWVANCLPPRQPCLQENIASLEARMPVPLLGEVRAQADETDDLLESLISALQAPAQP